MKDQYIFKRAHVRMRDRIPVTGYINTIFFGPRLGLHLQI